MRPEVVVAEAHGDAPFGTATHDLDATATQRHPTFPAKRLWVIATRAPAATLDILRITECPEIFFVRHVFELTLPITVANFQLAAMSKWIFCLAPGCILCTKLAKAEAHHEAGRWEHVISPSVEDAFLRILEDPTTCPHGNPIPGTDYQMPEGASALSDIGVGNKFIVERIPEELEFQPGLLEFLEESNLIPGENGKVTAVSPDGTTTVEVKGTMVGVGAFASQRILVTT